ncbi:MAG: tripartite tricarboxylate transporter substrate binding protein [Betaproteobacteria bacterium]|nr:tripartite tricarboxylate transporter substrate binding protein [Betaproteobacteria bacterium]
MKSILAMTVVSVLAFTTCALAAQRPAPDGSAQNFPARPIRVIVPQAPGGSNDIMARYIGGQLAERVGRPVVVDNRPGAEGMIGTEIVARATPDGYTLLMASRAFTMNPAVVKKLPYDPIKDFDWVAMLGNGPVLITVGPSLPVSSLKELLALGKAKPNYITIASAGGFMHFVSAMFRSHAGIDAVIALYKGGAPALIDVTSGQAHMAVATFVTANPHIRSGRLKPLATGGLKRLAAMPDLPTAAEAGLPGYEAGIWWAWATTAGTPASVINKLNTEVAAILKRPETAKRFASASAEVDIRTPAEIRKMIPADVAKWEKVARDAGMQKN